MSEFNISRSGQIDPHFLVQGNCKMILDVVEYVPRDLFFRIELMLVSSGDIVRIVHATFPHWAY